MLQRMLNFKQYYKDSVRPQLVEEFGYKCPLAAPMVRNLVISVGIGKVSQDAKRVDEIVSGIASISGQKPSVVKAKKSVAGFKVRAGMKAGVVVTLRNNMAYDFIWRMTNIAMPRIKDFRGLSKKSFDGHGNFSFGIKEALIFPELPYDRIEQVFGMNITIVTTAKNNDEGCALLTKLGFPFR